MGDFEDVFLNDVDVIKLELRDGDGDINVEARLVDVGILGLVSNFLNAFRSQLQEEDIVVRVVEEISLANLSLGLSSRLLNSGNALHDFFLIVIVDVNLTHIFAGEDREERI